MLRMVPLPRFAGEDIPEVGRYPPPWSEAEWGRGTARRAVEGAHAGQGIGVMRSG